MQDPFALLVGQPQAIDALRSAVLRPVHAYLFVGPAGAGKQDAARAFSAALLGDERALRDVHPDVITVEREGAAISVDQAREISRLAARSPIEGDRKVLILTEFHLVDEAAPALLKTIEEATETTVFVILADSLTRELATVASRCVKIEFRALQPKLIAQQLQAEGVSPERAEQAAQSSFGNLSRARILAVDDAVLARRNLWASTFDRLDGTGSSAAKLADEITAALDHACEPLVKMQMQAVDDMKNQSKDTGVSVTSAKAIEANQKRQLRRLRTDELRAGFATLSEALGRRFRDASGAQQSEAIRAHLDAVAWANEALQFNPSEGLLLQSLFAKLSR